MNAPPQTAPPHDWRSLIANKTKEIERLNKIYGGIMKNAGVDLMEGKGRIVGPHTVEMEMTDGTKKQLTAKNILVATGGPL